ncbi:MAG: hypothetical protein RL148_440 [Planctomycetota bacterium]|jgi:hypothetical protein
MSSPVQLAWNLTRSAWHGLAGRVTYHLGLLRRSRGHFQRVLELEGDVFSAYVHLGRLAWLLGDYPGWRREFDHARRTDPVRFGKLRHALDPRPSQPGPVAVEEAGERATWRSVRSSGQQGTRSRGSDAVRETARGDTTRGWLPFETSRNPAQASRIDDCRDESERARFARLGPILPADLLGVDVDDLSRRLGS